VSPLTVGAFCLGVVMGRDTRWNASSIFGMATALAFLLSAGLVISAPSASAVVQCTPTGGFTNCVRYDFTGADQSFTVPAGVTSIRPVVNGAGGRNTTFAGSGVAGSGGRTTGTINGLIGGTTLTLTVGGFNGFGGGGAGGAGTRGSGGNGGGFSAVWQNRGTNTPFLLAGGGGGAAGANGPLARSGGNGGGNAQALITDLDIDGDGDAAGCLRERCSNGRGCGEN
jgi:hypothetical protein